MQYCHASVLSFGHVWEFSRLLCLYFTSVFCTCDSGICYYVVRLVFPVLLCLDSCVSYLCLCVKSFLSPVYLSVPPVLSLFVCLIRLFFLCHLLSLPSLVSVSSLRSPYLVSLSMCVCFPCDHGLCLFPVSFSQSFVLCASC